MIGSAALQRTVANRTAPYNFFVAMHYDFSVIQSMTKENDSMKRKCFADLERIPAAVRNPSPRRTRADISAPACRPLINLRKLLRTNRCAVERTTTTQWKRLPNGSQGL
jgi:hypothetical protein